jgi:hypothetical protein
MFAIGLLSVFFYNGFGLEVSNVVDPPLVGVICQARSDGELTDLGPSILPRLTSVRGNIHSQSYLQEQIRHRQSILNTHCTSGALTPRSQNLIAKTISIFNQPLDG